MRVAGTSKRRELLAEAGEGHLLLAPFPIPALCQKVILGSQPQLKVEPMCVLFAPEFLEPCYIVVV